MAVPPVPTTMAPKPEKPKDPPKPLPKFLRTMILAAWPQIRDGIDDAYKVKGRQALDKVYVEIEKYLRAP